MLTPTLIRRKSLCVSPELTRITASSNEARQPLDKFCTRKKRLADLSILSVCDGTACCTRDHHVLEGLQQLQGIHAATLFETLGRD